MSSGLRPRAAQADLCTATPRQGLSVGARVDARESRDQDRVCWARAPGLLDHHQSPSRAPWLTPSCTARRRSRSAGIRPHARPGAPPATGACAAPHGGTTARASAGTGPTHWPLAKCNNPTPFPNKRRNQVNLGQWNYKAAWGCRSVQIDQRSTQNLGKILSLDNRSRRITPPRLRRALPRASLSRALL
jgi:hypothetical protein